jgi:hypothetical protein
VNPPGKKFEVLDSMPSCERSESSARMVGIGV